MSLTYGLAHSDEESISEFELQLPGEYWRWRHVLWVQGLLPRYPRDLAPGNS